MNRVGLSGLAVALVLSSSTTSTTLAATPVETPCSPISGVDDIDVEVAWGDGANRPVRWERATLRIDVVLTSRPTGAVLCDPDAWVEIHQIAPVRRLIDAGPVAVVDDGGGHSLHRFEWAIRDRAGTVAPGTYEFVFASSRPPVIELGDGDRHITGFVPIVSTRTVTKLPTPKKNSIERVGRR
jgi:hypothetical protein